MNKLAIFAILGLLTIYLPACSVVQATNSPGAKDLSVLDKGTDRYTVLAELGQPVVSEKDDNGNKIDVFKFVQGQHGAAKVGKGLLYGVMAVGTLGLSEIITSPLEGAIGSGAEMQMKVTYDSNNAVSHVTMLKDGRWLSIQDVNKN